MNSSIGANTSVVTSASTSGPSVLSAGLSDVNIDRNTSQRAASTQRWAYTGVRSGPMINFTSLCTAMITRRVGRVHFYNDNYNMCLAVVPSTYARGFQPGGRDLLGSRHDISGGSRVTTCKIQMFAL